MKSGLFRAASLIAAMASMPARKGQPFGDAAKDLTIEQARRFVSRLDRQAFSSTGGMPLKNLVEWSSRQRRSRQTKPGKRGKRARA